MGLLDPPATAVTKQALASAVLARMSRADGEKQALYTGPAPVWTLSAPNPTSGTIANGVLYQPRKKLDANGAPTTAVDIDNDPTFRYLNTIAMEYGGAWPDSQHTRPPLQIGGASQAAFWWPRISFWYDGQAFEWFGKSFADRTSFRMRINGKLVTTGLADIGTSGANPGSTFYWKCDLGSAAMRLIEIDFSSTPSFGGIVAESTAHISRGPAPTLRMAAITDSIGAGAGVYSRIDSWVGVLAELMGNDVAMYNAGIGGTGYATAVVGTNDFITRIPDLVAAKPDIVLVQGEQNDGALSAAQLQTAATTFYTALKAALPKALVFVIGSYSAPTPTSAKIGHEDALRTAAAAAGFHFISWVDTVGARAPGASTPAWVTGKAYQRGDLVLAPSGAPQVCTIVHTAGATFDQAKFRPAAVFTGTGKAGATTGDGNADVMIQSDGIHPTVRGSVALGTRVYSAMKGHLRAVAATGPTGIV